MATPMRTTNGGTSASRFRFGSTSTSSEAAWSEFWEDDFRPLQAAGEALLAALREEEGSADSDLYRRLTGSGSCSHLYFLTEQERNRKVVSFSEGDDENSRPGTPGVRNGPAGSVTPPPYVGLGVDPSSLLGLTHIKSKPLPAWLSEQLMSVSSYSLMGLLPEASLAWMSVESKVFLWSFSRDETLFSFQVPSKQPVVSVGIVKPKQGVFASSVEWCLIVSTTEEVLLYALTSELVSNDNGLSLTPFNFPTDNVKMLSCIGTKSGRIFLGGDDGCLYEFEYEGKNGRNNAPPTLEKQLDEFYDGDRDLPPVLFRPADTLVTLTKRAWKSVGGNASKQDSPRKCRKINRTQDVSSGLVSSLVPDSIVQAATHLLTGRASVREGGKIIQMVVDEERNTLYTLGSKGWVCSYDLTCVSGSSSNGFTANNSNGVCLAAAVDMVKTARSYLEAVSKGKMIAPVYAAGGQGYISFPGGGGAAQAGVGGMEGARKILKLADKQNNTNRGRKHERSRSRGKDDDGARILKPISIHVVPRSESSRLTLVVVTAGGIRYYCSSLAQQVLMQGPNGESSYRSKSYRANPLAPSGRLTLCHIRAPPPLQEIQQRLQQGTSAAGSYSDFQPDGTFPEGLSPGVGSVSRIDASLYNRGLLVLAAEASSRSASRSSTTTGNSRSIGDFVVSACPDSVMRKRQQQRPQQERIAPCGISETVSTPMSSADSVSHSSSGRATILQWGFVWDMALISTQRDEKYHGAVSHLMSHSKTPSDAELSAIGIPPPYIPPAKKSSNSQEPLYRVSTRDGSCGFSVTAAELSPEPSRSASGAPPTRTSSPASSVRLNSWLLRPSPVPLSRFATQHLHGACSQEIVALNAGGLHFFAFNTVLANLAEALINVAGDQLVKSDPTIGSFFDSYGFKEGCAMCLALAIGSGPASISSANSMSPFSGEQLRKRASDAALGRALHPRLLLEIEAEQQQRQQYVGAFGLGNSWLTSAVDSLVPIGYCFQSSALSQGLMLLLSRLVRPVWHKPAVVVTEGRVVSLPFQMATVGGNNSRVTPAKVELLLGDEHIVAEIRSPLLNLLGLMKKIFKKAVETVPGSKNQSIDDVDMMDVDNDGNITRALQFHHRQQRAAANAACTNTAINSTAGVIQQLTLREAESCARLLEEMIVHSAYRLLARVVQVLNFFLLLHRIKTKPLANEVDWGLLHGITFSQLVQADEGQKRLESVFNALLLSPSAGASGGAAAASSDGAFGTSAAQADQVAKFFDDQCYLLFPPGSRFAYLGLRKAEEALSLAARFSVSLSSDRWGRLRNEAAAFFMCAAQYWYSASQVTGRILHKGKETAQQIALRAMHHGSPLAEAVNALIRLDDVANAVQLCLRTAANFRQEKQSLAAVPLGGGTNAGGKISYAFGWEQNLYHRRRDEDSMSDSGKGGHNGRAGQFSAVSASVPSSSPSSPRTHIIAYGAAVTSKDAIETCYALIFHHLLILIRKDSPLADQMASACAASTDQTFLGAFFSFLLDMDCKDTLLRIDSNELRKWLEKRNDFQLLWQYFKVQGQHMRAGDLSLGRARISTEQLPLAERIDLLSRALTSFNAVRSQSASGGEEPNSVVEDKATHVETTLRIARLQSRILSQLEAIPEAKRDISSEQVHRLQTQLVDVSDLYNDYACSLRLHDICLLIFHACRRDERDSIRRLWNCVIFREIFPCGTREQGIFDSIRLFSPRELGHSVRLLGQDEPASNQSIFEEGDWVEPLQNIIVRLGKEIYGPWADYVFPVDFLIARLEELRQIFPRLRPPSWSLIVMADVGVPYLVILDKYDIITQRHDRVKLGGTRSARHLDQIAARVELLEHWVLSASSASQGDELGLAARLAALDELRQSMQTKKLTLKIEQVDAELESVRKPLDLVSRLVAVKTKISQIIS